MAARAAPLAAAICVVVANAAANELAVLVWNQQSRLRTLEVGDGSRPLMLLHGYGSAPRDWLPFCETIHLTPSWRFVFPEGPGMTLPPDGPPGGRAWWRLDLGSYRRGTGLPDLSAARPAGLADASRRTRLLLQDVHGRRGHEARDTVLGGFSQGAMIAADVAFRTDEPLRALVLLSGTFVDEARWTAGMPRRRGLPVFIAHGRQDDVLPFESARRLSQAMRAAGLSVMWVPFEGGHEIPAGVVADLNAFLAAQGAER